jgi:hypothetical protein
MKKITRILFLAIAISTIFVFNGCKLDELPSLVCKVDNTAWTSGFRETTFGATDLGDGFLIVATTGTSVESGAYLTILVRGADVKTYDLAVALEGTKMQCSAVYFPNGISGAKYIGKSGTVTITDVNTLNKKVSGTFNFTLSNSLSGANDIVITDGVFENLKYIKADISVSMFQ